MSRSDTPLHINYFAGPGAGKSTTAAATFVNLKKLGMNVELVCEYAKDCTWEERWGALACQPHIFGEQLFRVERFEGKVDLIVTDSPIFLSAIYNETYPESFTRAVVDIFKARDNLNFFIDRTKPYVKHGRTQSFEEAKGVDRRVREALERESIPYYPVRGTADEVVKVVLPQIFDKLGVDISAE